MTRETGRLRHSGPRHLSTGKPGARSIGKLAGHTAARGLGLSLVGLVVVLPAGMSGTSHSIAAADNSWRGGVSAQYFAGLGPAVNGVARGFEMARPAGPQRVRLPRAPRTDAAADATAGQRSRWVRPNSGILTSPFGMRWGRLHAGIDLGGRYGSPVLAATDGVVTFAGFKNGYQRYVMIDHGHGLKTAYAHMSATLVHVGQRVHAGEQIAREGTAGSGAHLHFEIWRNGVPVNPIPILRSHGVYI